MSTHMFEGGYVVSNAQLEKLQRRFGLEVTPRAKAPDPMGAYNLKSTLGCPCDDCRFKSACRAECDTFGRWVELDSSKHRLARADARRRAQRLDEQGRAA